MGLSGYRSPAQKQAAGGVSNHPRASGTFLTAPGTRKMGAAGQAILDKYDYEHIYHNAGKRSAFSY